MACDHGGGQVDRSDLTIFYGNNDVHCHDVYSGIARWSGFARCGHVTANNRCDHWRVQFDLADFDPTPDNDFERNAWQYVGCQELGHTASLAHRNVTNDLDPFSCMRDDAFGISTHLDNHDIRVINGTLTM